MPHYNVVIETKEQGDGSFRAEMVDGPAWAKGFTTDTTRDGAYRAAVNYIRADPSFVHAGRLAKFDFMHVEQ